MIAGGGKQRHCAPLTPPNHFPTAWWQTARPVAALGTIPFAEGVANLRVAGGGDHAEAVSLRALADVTESRVLASTEPPPAILLLASSSANRGSERSGVFRSAGRIQQSPRTPQQRCSSGHENPFPQESPARPRSRRAPGTGDLVWRTQSGTPFVDDGLRARAFRWRPLRLARVRCERVSVCVVRPLVLRITNE